MFGSSCTVNYTEKDTFDHDVTIIGWDNHFPKEYFMQEPAQDGAWIVYNSNVGQIYYYISYCSPLGYSISHTVSDKYSEVLSFDAGNEQDRLVKTGDSTKTANVFHKKGKLAAVGTYNGFDKQDIKIEIMSADLKKVLYTQDAVLDYHGYHTVELTKPVDVEDFAVAVTYSKGAPVEGETIENDSGMYKTVSEKGQSFVFTGGKWKDMTDKDIKTVLKTYNGQSASAGQIGAVRDSIDYTIAGMYQSVSFLDGIGYLIDIVFKLVILFLRGEVSYAYKVVFHIVSDTPYLIVGGLLDLVIVLLGVQVAFVDAVEGAVIAALGKLHGHHHEHRHKCQ